jgi:outer membrane protein assembly factor BamA
LLFAFGSFSSHAQPSRHSHKYFGFNLPLPKNKNPNELLHWLNNKGYPYAQLELDTLMFDGKSSEFTWNISPGKRILLDTIITPNILFNKRTLQRCLNYEPGQPYSTDKVQSIGDALSQISFLKPNAQVSIRMHSETFSITIKADRKKNNVISALIALQPKPNSSQSILTGNIDLEFPNPHKHD